MLGNFNAHICVNNVPDKFPKSRYVVVTIDPKTKELWYYGAYDDIVKAQEAAKENEYRFWFFNYGNAISDEPDVEECHKEDFHSYDWMEDSKGDDDDKEP